MSRIADPETVGIPPNLWPPVLELPNGKWLGQTAAIVDYLSTKLGLAGYANDDANLDEEEKAFLRAKNLQLVLTTLDLATEASAAYSGRSLRPVAHALQAHDVHHPVSVNLYYEDQKAEAIRAAEQFKVSRLLKFLHHFQSVLETNPANKDGKGTVFYFSTIPRNS